MRFRFPALLVTIFFALVGAVHGIILLDTADTTANTTTPGDNSGWQYEGQFDGYLGTPIAPLYFVTAHHIQGTVGDTFTFHGQSYTTTAIYDDPDTDLRIWQVDSSHPFAVYAPLYQEPLDANNQYIPSEVGQELRVFGRGTQRGAAMMLNGTLHGWAWGTRDDVQRWGSNIVTALAYSGSSDWYFVQAAFDSPGLAHEAHLSVGDSGGGVFILQDGLWRLAGINYGVDDLYTPSADGTTYNAFAAAIFDERGYYIQDAQNPQQYDLVAGAANVPTSFYSTQISVRNTWIQGTTGVDPSTLPTESFSDWLTAYFSPTDIANAAVSGPNADPDGDGISNLLEFAFNLDPTFAEPVVMTASTGVRGLPLIQLEQVAASDQRLTVEFVRRTAASGSGLTYTVQFSTSPGSAANWQAGGTESVTAINARWERVKVTDTVSAGSAVPVRFARVAVTMGTETTAAATLSRTTAKR